ncbi:cupin domain-containing protein [Kordia sp. YSTF-M3]|uniref:Cupin domain-containing protein n=1 Tax=Kordia aestuariivivens TaxID=2759037 RepID=A0ABR7QE83_9FLAO|nr:cupin domain-containing protein [Kordia aestuariivivens]MBC8756882.1 cupin domain-containing protein [Kordia aestuariivivens]
MEQFKKIDWENLKHEYGLDGQRLLPWGEEKHPFPFGGAYCVLRADTISLEHVNEPSDEKEMFIVTSGKAKVYLDETIREVETGDIVYIPKGVSHFLENPYKEDCHFYALWWNAEIISGYINSNSN